MSIQIQHFNTNLIIQEPHIILVTLILNLRQI